MKATLSRIDREASVHPSHTGAFLIPFKSPTANGGRELLLLQKPHILNKGMQTADMSRQDAT